MPALFLETEFLLLIVLSVVAPVGIYIFLYRKLKISRWTVVLFALLLIALAAVDVVLLQSLAGNLRTSQGIFHDGLISTQLSVALYLLPAAFAGLGINLISHVLINHLNEAEKQFDQAQNETRSGVGKAGKIPFLFSENGLGRLSDTQVLWLCLIAIALILMTDIQVGSDIRLHILYVFPLALFTILHTSMAAVFVMMAITLMAQIITFHHDGLSVSSFATDALVALVTNVLLVFMARQMRISQLALTEQATRDALTGLPNRHAFMTVLEDEIKRQQRYGHVFSLAMVDLDGFKGLNDTQGHAAGDEALRLVAEVLHASTRASDAVGRLGGDEFAVLLPHTQEEACASLLQQLCDAIAKRMAQAGFPVTASIGHLSFSTSPNSASEAMQRADDLMYQAKRSGKNRAVCA